MAKLLGIFARLDTLPSLAQNECGTLGALRMNLMPGTLIRVSFCVLAVSCLFPGVPSWAALLGGICFALQFGNPFAARTKVLAPRLLALSIIGLGAGMDLGVIGKVGASGVGYTIVGIVLTLLVGQILGTWLTVTRNTRLLVSVGTAICGGSAIAAAAAVIRPREEETSISLATVFLLNASALLLFPLIGQLSGLSPTQFGLWSALAIHDTSSVVGAAIQYSPASVDVATTVKLARALWIIPLTLGIGFFWRSETVPEGPKTPLKRPWFILWFLLAAALVTWIPELRPAGAWVSLAAKRLMVVTLFLIGAGLTKSALQKVGWRPFALGVLLWFVVGTATFLSIQRGWITV